MFDIFCIAIKKTGLFPHERVVSSEAEAQKLSRTRYFWIVNYLCDYSGFDFLWEPVPWEAHQRHAWASQWQKDSGTYLVPKQGYSDTNYHRSPVIQRLPDLTNWTNCTNVEGFDFSWHPDYTDPLFNYQFGTQHQRTGGPTYCVPGATEVKYVDQIRVQVSRDAIPKYGIDHMDGNRDKLPECVKVGRFVDNYLDTLRRIADNVPQEHEFVWIVSSVCDYTDFDFSWHPEHWQASMLHVFPSNEQKFGDTFFMHVPTFRERSKNCELLEWYDLNFITHTKVPRRTIPIYCHEFDSQVDALKSYNFTAPLVEFARYDTLGYYPAVNLWRQETRAVTPLTPGASNVIIPRDTQNFVKTQVYDYPKIDKSIANWPDRLLDIVFIANGEPCAEQHWQWLQGRVAPYYGSLRLHRVDGVNGRAAAYKAAAAVSETDWFFAVFAKLEVDVDFPWDWQPDRLQAAKHYIFHAKNPVNGLEYGHQAMIAYNKRLVLANPGKGLDFTLDDAHEVVPILSGVARYNYTPWMAWRTAFREVLKLKANLPDMESAYRIKQWCKTPQDDPNDMDSGDLYSYYGSIDAVEYYDAVNGDFDELKKSYEWDWLASYAFLKRNLLPDPQ
jgi:hypothetical protein